MGNYFFKKTNHCNNCELNQPLLDKNSCVTCYHMEPINENFQSLLGEEQKKSLFACILKIPYFYINRNNI